MGNTAVVFIIHSIAIIQEDVYFWRPNTWWAKATTFKKDKENLDPIFLWSYIIVLVKITLSSLYTFDKNYCRLHLRKIYHSRFVLASSLWFKTSWKSGRSCWATRSSACSYTRAARSLAPELVGRLTFYVQFSSSSVSLCNQQFEKKTLRWRRRLRSIPPCPGPSHQPPIVDGSRFEGRRYYDFD